MRRRINLSGLGLLSPADVPSRLRPWAVEDTPLPPGNPAPSDFLQKLAQENEQFFRSFAGRSQANPNQPQYDARAPWIDPPPGYETFQNPGIINTPANNGTDNTVQTLTVPQGWDGVISHVANFYTGPGFVAGSGNMIWRITRNAQPIKNLDNIQVAFGTYTQNGGIQFLEMPAKVRIFAGDVIKYVVNHAAASQLAIAGTQIITFLGGYLYPKPT